MIAAVKDALNDVSKDYEISSIQQSATTNRTHADKSPHYSGLGLDMNFINGVHVNEARPIVKAFQDAFQQQSGVQDNFGPFYLMKNGIILDQPKHEALKMKHLNHIHWTVN